jgi:hypothetical protein
MHCSNTGRFLKYPVRLQNGGGLAIHRNPAIGANGCADPAITHRLKGSGPGNCSGRFYNRYWKKREYRQESGRDYYTTFMADIIRRFRGMREAVHCIGTLLIVTGCLGIGWMCLLLSQTVEQAFHGGGTQVVAAAQARHEAKRVPFVLMPDVDETSR